MKKAAFFLAFVFAGFQASGQNVQVDQLKVKAGGKIMMDGQTITDVETSMPSSPTNGQVLTAPAIKNYVDAATDGLYQKAVNVTGSTITASIALPTANHNQRLKIFRDGVKLRYGDDFTISGSTITLVLSASSETFEIYSKP